MNWRIFFTLIKPFYKDIFLIFSFNLITVIFFTIKSYALKLLIDSIAIQKNIYYHAFYFFLINIICEICWRYKEYLSIFLNPNMRKHLNDYYSNLIMNYGETFHQKNQSSVILNAIKNILDGSEEIIVATRNIISRVTFVISTLINLYLLDFFIGSITFFWTLIWLILSIIFGKKIFNISKKMYVARSFLNEYLDDVFSNITTVKTYNTINYENEKIKNASKKNYEKEVEKNTIFFKLSIFHTLSFFAVMFFSFYFLNQKYEANLITIGAFAMFFDLLIMIYWYFEDLASDIVDFLEMSSRFNEGASVFHNQDFTEIKFNNGNLECKQGEIILKDLAYKYPDQLLDSNNFLLEGELKIKAGSSVAVVGPSGGGKSTLFKLLLNLIEPDSGKILIDGQDINLCNVESVRNIFALIPQELGIFRRSIAENIKYGSFNKTLEEIEEVAKKTQIDSIINSYEKKFDTIFGKEVNLSGGQKQRIIIARGLLRNAKIFLFDEATSALDAKTEYDVINNINEITKGCTKLIIAHRLKTVQNADLILVFDKGRLVESGSHTELMSKNGLYASLTSLI